ncbi:hypothetical protein BIY26_09530 [Brenneria goodwinii]|uniref:Uncharacterized protein n=1 Tax=Brenneria goodwinii TaxID=1109412 RepID=A0A250B923_9GAMM|nr:hypothetical protein [Brenneria goodwinii]ATA22627.1 hypothetical protein AWC36_00015 [Brenneria goodwinii]ATA23541.1 hypothetical protein AWC36_05155 [Brenneria goodwinii]ATA26816.1 hypothetical protein AWC36_23425 [Brenneria goodwinii]RLM25249.1 hypothetical protein BIY26_09530 [Brenneria goodwinii]
MNDTNNAILKSAAIGDGVIHANKLRETEEQRRITAIEERVVALESALSGGTITATRILKIEANGCAG